MSVQFTPSSSGDVRTPSCPATNICVPLPVIASERSLARAVAFVHDHFAEPLAAREVAKIAGFAPGYFSQLFKRREKMTFESYVRRLRVRRAQQLLKGTDLSADRISQLCGFALRPYFFRVFKSDVGMTPIEYRAANPPPAWRKAITRQG